MDWIEWVLFGAMVVMMVLFLLGIISAVWYGFYVLGRLLT